MTTTTITIYKKILESHIVLFFHYRISFIIRQSYQTHLVNYSSDSINCIKAKCSIKQGCKPEADLEQNLGGRPTVTRLPISKI